MYVMKIGFWFIIVISWALVIICTGGMLFAWMFHYHSVLNLLNQIWFGSLIVMVIAVIFGLTIERFEVD